MTEGGYSKNDSNVETGGQFLIGYKRKLYTVESDFQVARTTDRYNSVGCGQNYAMGTLFATQHNWRTNSPYERVKFALECAARFSAGVKGPMKIKELER